MGGKRQCRRCSYCGCEYIHTNYTRSSGQQMLRHPGSSWGFGALLKVLTSVVALRVERVLDIHSPTYNPCQTWDSNPGPLGYKPDSLPLGHDCPTSENTRYTRQIQPQSWFLQEIINIPGLLWQNYWFVRGIETIAVSVCHKAQILCAAVCVHIKKCNQKKPYVSFGCEMLIYTVFLWPAFAINTCDCTYICLLCALYCSEMGRFRVGVGLSAPMKSIIYIKLFQFFYKCMQTIKLRRTTENNGGPWTLKTDTKRIEKEKKKKTFFYSSHTQLYRI